MQTLSGEQRGFVIECLKSGMRIGHIVDDLIEIYGLEVDDSDRKKLYDRVQKIKSKLEPSVAETATDVSDTDTAVDILPTVSPQWRLSYLRSLLREAGGDVSLKTRLLREIRAEEQIIVKQRSNEAMNNLMRPLFQSNYLTLLRYQAFESMSAKKNMDAAFSELMGKDIDSDVAVGAMLGDRTFGMKESERRIYKVLEGMWEKGFMYPNSTLNTEDYDEIEAGNVYQRKCDGVLVDISGAPLTPGEKSDEQWREECAEQERREDYIELSEMDEESLRAHYFKMESDMTEERYQEVLVDIEQVLSEISADKEA